MLSGSLADVPAGSVVDLTAEGKLDWIHWGLFTDTSLNRKATVAPRINDFSTVVDTNNYTFVYQYGDNLNGYSWSDGMSAWSVTNTTTGVWAYNFVPVGNGFVLSIPADTNVTTLKLYVGAFNARGRLVASLSDGSAPAYTSTALVNMGNGPSGAYTLTFAAASAGQTLTITWTVAIPLGLNPNVTLQAAALSAANANNPPYASIFLPTNNAAIASSGSVEISADAADADGAVAKVEFYANGVKLGEDTSAPYTFGWVNPPAGRHVLTARVRDNLGATSTSRPRDFFVYQSGGSMAGSLTLPDSGVDLTGEGQADWAHWGLVSASSYNHKATGGNQISNQSHIGDHAIERFTNYYANFYWNDGTPVPATNGTQTGIFVTGWTNGFELTAPADTHSRTLRVYVGLYGARGTFQAYLSDASAAPYTDQSLNSVFGNPYGVYTVNYSAANAGQTVHVRFTSDETYDTDFGNVALAAATLAGGPAPLVLFESAIIGNTFTFKFKTEAGVSYTAEYTDALSPTNWQTLTVIPGNGDIAQVGQELSQDQRYYRVLKH